MHALIGVDPAEMIAIRQINAISINPGHAPPIGIRCITGHASLNGIDRHRVSVIIIHVVDNVRCGGIEVRGISQNISRVNPVDHPEPADQMHPFRRDVIGFEIGEISIDGGLWVARDDPLL